MTMTVELPASAGEAAATAAEGGLVIAGGSTSLPVSRDLDSPLAQVRRLPETTALPRRSATRGWRTT